MMRPLLISRVLTLTVCILLLQGCGTTNVQSSNSFPDLLIKPRPLRAAVVLTPEFSSYKAVPNKATTLEIGAAQSSILTQVFSALIDNVTFVESVDTLEQPLDIIIRPSVVAVQLAVPSGNYLNVYEVWIKYNLAISDSDDQLLANWFMPVYGKTADSFMLQKKNAISAATDIALRDIGAKLAIDFYRIPALQGYLNDRQREQ